MLVFFVTKWKFSYSLPPRLDDPVPARREQQPHASLAHDRRQGRDRVPVREARGSGLDAEGVDEGRRRRRRAPVFVSAAGGGGGGSTGGCCPRCRRYSCRRRRFRFFHDHEPALDDAARVDPGSSRAQALRRRRRAGQRVAVGGGGGGRRSERRPLVFFAVAVVRGEPGNDIAVVGPRAVPEPEDAVASSRDQGSCARGEQGADSAAGARSDTGRGEVGRQRRRLRRRRGRGRRKPSQRHRHRFRRTGGRRRRPQHEPGRPLGDLPQRGLPSRCAPDQRAGGRRQRRRSVCSSSGSSSSRTSSDSLPRRCRDRQRVDAGRPRQPPRRHADQQPRVPEGQHAARGAREDPGGAQGVCRDRADGALAGWGGQDPGVVSRRGGRKRAGFPSACASTASASSLPQVPAVHPPSRGRVKEQPLA